MTRDLQTSHPALTDARLGTTNSVPDVAPRGPSAMDQIVEEAAAGHCDRALDIAYGHDTQDPQIANAIGICLLRLGRTNEAVTLYRSLLFTPGCTSMRHDRPVHFKLNYATALLLSGQPDGCLEVLEEVGEQSTTAKRLREAIKRWEATLSFGQKLDWWINHVAPFGGVVRVDFVPGDFGPPETSDLAEVSPVLATQQLTTADRHCCLGD